jgi:DNA-binding MarR family transcriptional regulator
MIKQSSKGSVGNTINKKDDPRINLFILLEQTRDIVVHAVKLELNHYRTSVPQVKLLVMLSRENRELTFNELSNWALRELNSVSNLINKLEKRGLVKKLKKKGDEKTYIALTEKGSRFYDEEVTERSIHLIFDSLSQEEKKQLEALLKKVRDTTRDLLGIDYKPPFLP